MPPDVGNEREQASLPVKKSATVIRGGAMGLGIRFPLLLISICVSFN